MSATRVSDPEQLLELARGGSQPALGQLLEMHRSYLTLLARLQIGRRLQGKADASDIVQDAFLRAHRDFTKFHGKTEGELAGWLRQILAARLVDLVRRYCGTGRRDIRLEQGLVCELEQSSRCMEQGLLARISSPSSQLARQEQGVLLAETLARLPADYREVLILHHLEECTFPEIARRMGRSVEAVKKLWARALAHLRRTMGVV